MKNSVLVSILAIASTCVAQFDSEQCGPKAGNQRCRQNKCCSQYGWCGTSNAYCQATQGCQEGFGRCTGVLSTSKSSPSSSVQSSTVVASQSASAAPISRSGRCGTAFGGQTCKGSAFGDCCSTYNWCGKTTDHCKASLGCQFGFGTCIGVQSSSISVPLSRSSTTLSTRTSPSSSGSGSATSSQSSQSSSSSPTFTASSASRSSSTSISLSSSSSSSTASSSSSTISSSSSTISSSSVIATSSSSSFGASSSSSAVISTSAIAQSSSSTLISSTTTLASPSVSLISSTNTLTASSSASGSATVITHVLRAARNPSVDRTAPEHLVPKNALSFFFAEDSTTYTTSIQTNLDSGALGVLLENIAGISTVTCSGSRINLKFSDEASASTARSWPVGTILFTLSDGCNTATERGVYRLGATAVSTVAPLRARVTSVSQATNLWSLSLEALLIRMEEVIARYAELKQAAEAAAAASTSTSIPSNTANSVLITSTVSSVSASSTGAQPSASASALPACGGYAPGGLFDIGGTPYQISCTLAGTWHERWIDISYHESFAACMAYCNANVQCKVASYNEQQVVGGKYMCLRWPLLPYKTDNSANSPMAVKVVSVSSTLVTSTSIVSPPVSSS